MKTGLLLLITFLLSFLVNAQISADSLIKNYKLNFALPDLPAFKALGIQPSNLLRPSSIQDFSFVSSEFFNGTNLVIPSSFAIEISPILLLNTNKMTRTEYKKNNELKTSRISIGTQRDSFFNTNLSLGYRITLINKGDLRTDDKAFGDLTKLLQDRTVPRSVLRNEYLKKYNIYPGDITEEVETEIAKYIEDHIIVKQEEFENEIEEFKENYKDNNWNASKLDVAFAIVGQSPDSLFSNVAYKTFSFWTTYGFPILRIRDKCFLE